MPAGESPRYLAPQPVRLLANPELCGLLERLGLKTLGAFVQLPAPDVLARFGSQGLSAHRRASGTEEHLVNPRIGRPELELHEDLDPPTARCDVAVFAGKGLADRMAEALQVHGLACTKVAIEAVTEDGQTLTRTWRLDGGFSPGAIAQRVRWQLDGWLTGTAQGPPRGPLVRLGLIPQELTADRGVQLSFWGGRTEPGRRAAQGVARLQGLLGPQAVMVAEYRGGRGPAERFRLVPAGSVDLLNRSIAPPSAGEAPWPGSLPAPSPALVFSERHRVGILDGRGNRLQVRNGHLSSQPAQMALEGGRRLPVIQWAGPWPVHERWWDPATCRRLVRMQVLCADHSAYLVAFEDQSWWLEASYD